MKHYKQGLIAFFAVVVLGTPWLVSSYPKSAEFIDNLFGYVGKNYGAVFFRETVTVNDLQQKYEASTKKKKADKVRILVMPGHEPDFGGTEFGELKEREMVVVLSKYLEEFLRKNAHYEVIVARDEKAWNPELDTYFKNNWSEIETFVKESKEQMLHLVNDGSVKKITEGVIHNTAPQNVALRLFGINKWSNENQIDIAIHLHFNDYPRRNQGAAGKYSGFSIYVPERQFSNSTTTKAIADSIFKRLSKYNAVSDFPPEESGVIEEQELIAIGSYNTSDAPSMLIEYGYIYEPQFADPEVRDVIIRDLAFQTYLGIQDFFGSGNDVSLAYDTLILPHVWKENFNKSNAPIEEALALQSALMLEGVYPPANKTKNECPRSGAFGPCTSSALSAFQSKYGIMNEANSVGEETRKTLNNLYSSSIR